MLDILKFLLKLSNLKDPDGINTLPSCGWAWQTSCGVIEISLLTKNNVTTENHPSTLLYVVLMDILTAWILLVHQYADQSSTQCPPFSSFEDHFKAYPTFTIIAVDDSFISNKNQIAWGVVVWKPYSSPIMGFAASSYGLTAEHSELEAIYHSEMSTDRALIPTDSKLLVNAFQ